ncbi:MAG: U32 family peptidase, partial [Erysipelotrichaceae bacterium]|nr:U32 family peptidase [Erysipelotrichaceae bacterium]
IKYAHLYGVKVYVTVNTLMYEEEMNEVLGYIRFLYEKGVDAVILQDVGLATLVHKCFPELEMHASTQMHIHNIEGVRHAVSLGFTRVVLARECSLEEIKRVHDEFPDLELEVFCYGALCISYSGQCLFSSMIGGRSGNRGECAQGCRLPYELWKNDERVETKGDYLLSPKDQNALSFTDQMLDHGVYSFKIEGRMKRPEYVATAVKAFRKALDAAMEGKEYKDDPQDEKQRLSIFNRGFSRGYLKGTYGSTLMSQYRPNHQGIYLGSITEIDRRTHKASILLQEDLRQGDGIRVVGAEDEGFTLNFLYQNDLLVNQAKRGETVQIEYRNKPYSLNAKVYKTTDTKVMKEVAETYLKPQRYVDITMKLQAFVGKPLHLTLQEGEHIVEVVSDEVCDQAINRPLSKERVQEQLSKLKDTAYTLTHFEFISDDQCIAPISRINELRRKGIEQLNILRTTPKQRELCKPVVRRYKGYDDVPTFSVTVYTKEQLEACLTVDIDLIFVRNRKLYEDYKHHSNVVLASYRVNKDHKYKENSLLVCEMGALQQAVEGKKKFYIDFGMNVTNHFTVNHFNELGARRIMLSEELTLPKISAIAQKCDPQCLEVLVYGRNELMVSKHCVINANTCDTGRPNCNMCRGRDKYHLVDRKKEIYPIVTDDQCYNHIMHCRRVVAVGLLGQLQQMGIKHYRLAFTDETYGECLKVLHAYRKAHLGSEYTLDVEKGYLGYLGK